MNKDEILAHGYRYHERRIQNTQTIDLMCMYLKEFNELIERFKEIEKRYLITIVWRLNQITHRKQVFN